MMNEYTETSNRSQEIIRWMSIFSQSDNKRKFAFTSGNLGALPLPVEFFYNFISYKKFWFFWKNIIYLVYELLKFIVLSLIPLKNILLILRTFLRVFCNAKFIPLNSFCVISLGNQSLNNDAYFSRWLANRKDQFEYIKIVGGLGFRSTNQFFYVESALGFFNLISVVSTIIFLPFTNMWYLLWSCRKIKSIRLRLLYIYLCLKEINSGTFANNLIIVRSIKIALTNSTIKKIIFPMEGRNWEKLIVSYEDKKHVKTIGYIHCALTPFHFSLIHNGYYKSTEIPSVIITPSKMSTILLNKSFKGKDVRQGYFIRGSNRTVLSCKKASNKLLFVLTGNVSESKLIMSYISKSGVSKNIKIRLNPNSSSYSTLKNYAHALHLNLQSKDDNELPKVCFFRSSSVALDYLRLNVTPVYLNLHQIVSKNIFELDGRFKCMSLSVDSNFAINLDCIMKQVDSADSFSNGKELADYYLDQSYDLADLDRLINL